MMKSKKTFDCVKLKNDIQASLYHERKGMSQAEIHTAIDQKLATRPISTPAMSDLPFLAFNTFSDRL